MNIKRQMTAFALALLQIIALAACAEVPDSIDRDGVVVADTNNNAQESKTDDPALSIDSIPVSASKTPTEESLAIILLLDCPQTVDITGFRGKSYIATRAKEIPRNYYNNSGEFLWFIRVM